MARRAGAGVRRRPVVVPLVRRRARRRRRRAAVDRPGGWPSPSSALLVVPAVRAGALGQTSWLHLAGAMRLVAYATLVAFATATLAVGRWGVRVPDRLMRRLTAWVAGLVVLGQTWALFGTLQRYQGGIPADEVILHPTWSPPGGIVLWLVVVAAGTALAAFAVIAGDQQTGRRGRRGDDGTPRRRRDAGGRRRTPPRFASPTGQSRAESRAASSNGS